VAEEAGQVHRDRQLGPDPTGLGQPSCFQGAAGQLSQRIRATLGPAAGVVGIMRAGQGLQGGEDGLAGFGFQEPVDGDHALPGWGQPPAPAAVAPLPVPIGPSGSATSRTWPTTVRSRCGSRCRAAPNRAASASTVIWWGRSWGPWATTTAWAGEMTPAAKAAAVAVSGPRNNAWAVRTALAAAPLPSRNRRRSQLAVDPTCWPSSAPGGAAGVDPGQFLEPLAFQPIHQASQLQHPPGPGDIAEPVQVAGVQPVEQGRQGLQVISGLGWLAIGWPGRPWVECVFESMTATYQFHRPTQPPNPRMWTTVQRSALRT
jgi:hypothetical protein